MVKQFMKMGTYMVPTWQYLSGRDFPALTFWAAWYWNKSLCQSHHVCAYDLKLRASSVKL
eukprot:659254-Pelagomonas_calceolata.AAC.1